MMVLWLLIKLVRLLACLILKSLPYGDDKRRARHRSRRGGDLSAIWGTKYRLGTAEGRPDSGRRSDGFAEPSENVKQTSGW